MACVSGEDLDLILSMIDEEELMDDVYEKEIEKVTTEVILYIFFNLKKYNITNSS